MSSGTLPNNGDNSSYIWSVPKQSGQGWHKYRVHCASYEVFLPSLGSCFIDPDKLKEGSVHILQSRDIDVIKSELEELKLLEKRKLREEKLKLKLKKKLEKQMVKKAIQEAKDRAKFEGKSSEESQKLVCTAEGSFPSNLGRNFYTNCVFKKGKFKAFTMLCSSGLNFDEKTAVCI